MHLTLHLNGCGEARSGPRRWRAGSVSSPLEQRLQIERSDVLNGTFPQLPLFA
jgi:hypothetical protein